jgi:hypothetical protein
MRRLVKVFLREKGLIRDLYSIEEEKIDPAFGKRPSS